MIVNLSGWEGIELMQFNKARIYTSSHSMDVELREGSRWELTPITTETSYGFDQVQGFLLSSEIIALHNRFHYNESLTVLNLIKEANANGQIISCKLMNGTTIYPEAMNRTLAIDLNFEDVGISWKLNSEDWPRLSIYLNGFIKDLQQSEFKLNSDFTSVEIG